MYRHHIRKTLLFIVAIVISGCSSVSIYEAASRGNLGEVIKAAGRGSSAVNRRFPSGSTPLLAATNGGHFEVVKYLVSKGADINAFDTVYHFTPLHAAVWANKPDIVKYLVSKGASINPRTTSDETPLHLAVNSGKVDLAKYLIDSGADVNVKNADGDTLLDVAYERDNEAMVAVLKKAGLVDYKAERINHNVNPFSQETDPFNQKANRVNQKAEPVNQEAEPVYQKADGTGQKTEPAYQKTEQAVKPTLRPKTKPQPLVTSKPKTFLPARTGKESVSVKPVTASSNVDFGRYHALVIGNGNYEFLPRLETARNDAETIARLLKADYGFNVKLLTDATRSDILMAMEEYRRNLVRNDNLLIYYAGHGWLDELGDEGYWLPVDASSDNPVNWLSNASITTSIKALPAKHVLIVSDSCYAGKLARGVHIVRRTRDYYSKIVEKRARSVLASGGLEPVVDQGGAGNHSVFASVFISALGENKGIMDGTQLFTKIRGPVMLNSDQTPQYSDIRKAGHEGGDFIFVRRRK